MKYKICKSENKVKLYRVGSYAITVIDEKIVNFELLQLKGSWVPKIGQLLSCYCMKVGIAPLDITPEIKKINLN